MDQTGRLQSQMKFQKQTGVIQSGSDQISDEAGDLYEELVAISLANTLADKPVPPIKVADQLMLV